MKNLLRAAVIAAAVIGPFAVSYGQIGPGGGGGTLVIGATPVSGGTTSNCLTINGAVLGQAACSGGGTTNTIASGATALGTTAVASAACSTAITATATGVATTDTVTASFNSDPTAVTGYIPSTSGGLAIFVYPTTNTVNFKVCNSTSASITPGAITLNWRVVR